MIIEEIKNTNKILIGNQTIQGFISNEKCKECKSEKIYSEEFDALFCPKQNKWLEDVCDSKECEYCPIRPLSPIID